MGAFEVAIGRMLTLDQTVYSIWLSLLLKPGSRLVAPLFDYFSSAEEIYENRENLPDALPLTEMEREGFRKLPLTDAEKVIEDCEEKEYGILTVDSNEYPKRLREIYDFPPVLYRAGLPLNVDEQLSIGVVGTRHPTQYALEATRQIVSDLVQSGAVIISGLAVGIDATAHAAAIRGKGYTVAVVGGGLDINYPKANEKLRMAIEKTGTVISEYPPGVEPAGYHFPIRNRILSGLTDGVFVTEGSLRSGTLRTASHAVEQGRDVFVLPGSIFNAKADGTFQLLKDGAAPVASALDILENYLEKYPERIGNIVPSIPKEKESEKNRRNSFKEKSNSSPILEKSEITFSDLHSLSEEEKQVFLKFPSDPIHLEELALKLQFSLEKLLPLITSLEMQGIIESKPGRMYKRCYKPPVEEPENE